MTRAGAICLRAATFPILEEMTSSDGSYLDVTNGASRTLSCFGKDGLLTAPT